jgi:hypothetical protein
MALSKVLVHSGANRLSIFPSRLGGKNSKDRVKRFCLNRSLMNMKNVA